MGIRGQLLLPLTVYNSIIVPQLLLLYYINLFRFLDKNKSRNLKYTQIFRIHFIDRPQSSMFAIDLQYSDPAATHNLFKNKTMQQYDSWHYQWGFFYLLLSYQNLYRRLFKVLWKKLFEIHNVYRRTKMANNRIGRRGWRSYCGSGCLCQTHYEYHHHILLE